MGSFKTVTPPKQLIPKQVILGTAGHIDHGKTALVEALTGTDTDRLPEEQRRGMTIDIGFAQLEAGGFHIGVVDVPGHERFIRNMVAGASGIDLALLVVAADDSVMPQTREHLDILKLLGLRHGLVAITKCDLAGPDHLELVREEIAELTAGSFLDQAPVIHTSAATGEGLDDLRSALAEVAAAAGERQAGSLFRMAVDRSFVMSGQGTVVTGSVGGGVLRVGDEVEWLPAGKIVRVRSLEAHGRRTECVRRAQRAAIGLAGVHHKEIARGHELATPGYLKPATLLTVRLQVRRDSPLPIKHRSRVRLHIGAAEIIATVSLLSGTSAVPGESADAQLFLAGPATASCGQPFILRSVSPLATLGGGQVLAAGGGLHRPIPRRHLDRFLRMEDLATNDDPVKRAAAALWFQDLEPWTNLDLCRDANIELEAVEKILSQLRSSGDLVELPLAAQRVARLHSDRVKTLGNRLAAEIRRYHEEHPLRSAMPRPLFGQALHFPGEEALLDAVIAWAAEQNLVTASALGVALREFQPRLSKRERSLLEEIVTAFEQARFQPPTPAELAQKTAESQSKILQIIELAVEDGRLAHLGGALYLDSDSERTLRSRVTERLNETGEITVGEIRELLETSRKFALPFCQYLDRIRITRRKGDLRVAAGGAKPRAGA